MAQTNVQRRTAGYYCRQKIPADLHIHYGKREIVRSLGEIDGADAEVRANRGMHGEINRLWSDLNGGPELAVANVAQRRRSQATVSAEPKSRGQRFLSRMSASLPASSAN
jgi:Domain of unknown function (DUF6538)